MATGGRCEQPALPVVGFLNSASASDYARPIAAFRRGLSEAGYIEGRNVLVEYRWAEGHYDQLPALAADLVRRKVAVIVAGGGPSAVASQTESMTIPIVFSTAADRVEIGLVASMSRPQCHRHKKFERGGMAETARTAARSSANGNHHGRTRESSQPQCQGHIERETGCGAQSGT
jgi:hypothetical protein